MTTSEQWADLFINAVTVTPRVSAGTAPEGGSFADDIAELFIHTVTVTPRLGTDSYGAITYGPTVTVPCLIADGMVQVRDGNDVEVTAQTTVAAALEWRAYFPPGSRVQLPNRAAEVITVTVGDGEALDLPSNILITLT